MSKLALFPVLLASGCAIAGLYGALHDQVSYTLSRDYFHHLKFPQFRVRARFHNRLGAALVGFRATWWMGLFVGAPLLTFGLFLPDARAYLTHCLAAFAVVAATAVAGGMRGLVWARRHITEDPCWPWGFPEGVTDRVGFAWAGVIHQWGYFGGFLGIPMGIAYLLIVLWVMHESAH